MSTLESAQLQQSAVPSVETDAGTATVPLRHSALVRITHWITTICFLALLVTGAEIVVSHPRFYWGETGTVLTEPWLKIPIPSSRRLVPSGYGYVLPDQNGWSRALHFQSAWVLVLVGLLYLVAGFLNGHFRKDLLPRRDDLSWRSVVGVVTRHVRLKPPTEKAAWSYNVLQRLTYVAVIFVLFPLMIWTGLALSPAFDSAVPATVNLLGGRQSARTLHFLLSVALVIFVLVHIALVWRAGFVSRVRAMITGKAIPRKEGL